MALVRELVRPVESTLSTKTTSRTRPAIRRWLTADYRRIQPAASSPDRDALLVAWAPGDHFARRLSVLWYEDPHEAPRHRATAGPAGSAAPVGPARPRIRPPSPAAWSPCTPPTRPRSTWPPGPGCATTWCAAVEQALYDDRSLIRMLGMRRTMFVAAGRARGRCVQAACTGAIAAQQRRQRSSSYSAEAGVGRRPGALARAGRGRPTVTALRQRGEATAAELSADDARAGRADRAGRGQGLRGAARASRRRVLLLLAADGRIGARAAARHLDPAAQYRWSPVRRPGCPAACPAGGRRGPGGAGPGVAVRRSVRHRDRPEVVDRAGPLGQVGQALTAIGAVEVDLDGDARPGPARRPRPGAGARALGGPAARARPDHRWAGRTAAAYLGPHRATAAVRPQRQRRPDGLVGRPDRRRLGPAVQRRGRLRLLEDVGTETTARIAERSAALSNWLGPARITPRFRTPLERELTA